MKLSNDLKNRLKQEIVETLKSADEIQRIMIFGSFVKNENPHDIDIAVFQDSDESYLVLALRYRKLVRSIAKKIPVDIIPLKSDVVDNSFLSDIKTGELIYER